MEVDDEFQLKADHNLKSVTISSLRNNLRLDGGENASMVLQDNVNKSHSTGLIQLLNILNPKAWKNFFNKLKSGGFKKKEHDKNAFDNFVKDQETHGIFLENNATQKSKSKDH